MKFNVSVYLIIMGLLLASAASARNHVEPRSFTFGSLDKNSIPAYVLPATDVAKSLEKHKYKDYQAKPLRFANPNKVSVTPDSHGSWTSVKGGEIWQLRFVSKGATDINYGITEFNLPKGVELHFLSFADSPVYFDGPYTHEDNKSYNQLWSAPLPGGDAGIELFVPDGVSKDFKFAITQVNTGFRDVFKRYGGPGLKAQKQGACNNDVVCPVGDPWRDEIRSVAAYTVNGIDTCTGTLIMDAERSFRPFFLTAFHCSVTAANAAGVVTIWNYESANCGDLSGGSRLETVSGSTFLSRRSDTDSGLIELSSTPPESFEVYWAGWDRSGMVPNGSVGIHHPGVDEKAISFNTDPLTTVNNCIGGGGSNTLWEVNNWEDGTTEPGSSGSGIWDPDTRHVVGFLSGCTASCSSITSDCYGKFSEAWDNGGPDNENLKPWLDPNNTGVMSVDGSDPSPFAIVPAQSTISVCSPDDAVYDLTLAQNDPGFIDPVTFTTANLPGSANDAFSNNPVVPPGMTQLTLSNIGSVSVGSHLFDVTGTAGAESRDIQLELIVNSAAPGATVLMMPADSATDVDATPTFSWTANSTAVSYLVEVATDMAFTNIVVSETTSDTSLVSPATLLPTTTYYWRVTASNDCGTGAVSAVFSFTTSADICFNGSVSVPDDDATGVDIDLNVPLSQLIDGVKVSVVSDHTFPGDFIFDVTHGATTVRLMDRPGVPATQFGCGQDGVDVVFDDDSATDVETFCAPTSPGITGDLNPDGDLSDFAGDDVSGTWTLTVTDNAGFDTGAITQFCIVPIESDVIFKNGFGPIP